MQLNSLQTPIFNGQGGAARLPLSPPAFYTLTFQAPGADQLSASQLQPEQHSFFPSDMLALEQPEMPANIASEFLNALLFSLGETLGTDQQQAPTETNPAECCCTARPTGSAPRPKSSAPPARKPSEGKPAQPPAPASKPAADTKKTKNSSDKSDDPELATKIDSYLEQHSSPGAGSGHLFLESAEKHGVDPLLLLAIAGHETGYGTLGIGANGMLGVGAYDDNPENALTDPQFAGIQNQLNVGGRTFAHWREHFGGSPDDPIEDQVKMVGQKWATDPNWHAGVMRHYAQIQEFFA